MSPEDAPVNSNTSRDGTFGHVRFLQSGPMARSIDTCGPLYCARVWTAIPHACQDHAPHGRHWRGCRDDVLIVFPPSRSHPTVGRWSDRHLGRRTCARRLYEDFAKLVATAGDGSVGERPRRIHSWIGLDGRPCDRGDCRRPLGRAPHSGPTLDILFPCCSRRLLSNAFGWGPVLLTLKPDLNSKRASAAASP